RAGPARVEGPRFATSYRRHSGRGAQRAWSARYSVGSHRMVGGVVHFVDRRDAGRRLAAELKSLRGANVVVLGLPRGGVPVAYEGARALPAPLDVLVVRKLGVPYQPELAFGAVGEDDVCVFNDRVLHARHLSAEEI